jgi:hypothetical protein
MKYHGLSVFVLLNAKNKIRNENRKSMALRRRRDRKREMGGRMRPYEFLWQNTVVFSLSSI